jgi:hypothetical protein
MKTVKITFADGTSGIVCNASVAQDRIAARYGVETHTLISDDSGDRELIWLDEESAENDDGAHAVAEIRPA